MKFKTFLQVLISTVAALCIMAVVPSLPALDAAVVGDFTHLPTPTPELQPKDYLAEHHPYVKPSLQKDDSYKSEQTQTDIEIDKDIQVVPISKEKEEKLLEAMEEDVGTVYDTEDEYFGVGGSDFIMPDIEVPEIPTFTPVPATPAPATPVPATPVPATPVPATPVPATPAPTPTPTIAPTPTPTPSDSEPDSEPTPETTDDAPATSEPTPEATGGEATATPSPTPTLSPTPSPTPTIAPTPTPTIAPTPTPTPAPQIPVITIANPTTNQEVLYNSFPTEYKLYTYEISKAYGVSYEMLLAIMYNESRFNASAINKTLNSNGTWDWGIMQINDVCLSFLKTNMGLTSMDQLLDPYKGIQAGAVLLSYYMRRYGGPEEDALLRYQMGASGANKYFESGTRPYVYTTVINNRTIYQNANLT